MDRRTINNQFRTLGDPAPSVAEREAPTIQADVSYTTLAEARQEVLRCLALYGLEGKMAQVTVAWSARAVRRRGSCSYKRLGGAIRIELSAKLWSSLEPEERRNTIRHEAAHAVDFLKNGRSDHSYRWKAIAVRVGARPAACTASSEKTLAHMKAIGAAVEIKCACRTSTCSRRVAKRILAGQRYTCRVCCGPVEVVR